MNKSIKMDRLSDSSLDERKMNELRGGAVCGCACAGKSSTADNGIANYEGGLSSPCPQEDMKMIIWG